VSTAQVNVDWQGGMLAEGYSSSPPDRAAELHHRVFTTTSTICDELVDLPVRFESSPSRIVIKTGDRFSLDDLILQAIGSGGEFLPTSPITVSLFYEPGVLTSDVPQGREFRGSSVGNGIVIVQAVCTGAAPPVRLEVPVLVGN
jgi:hypothetical protein